MWRYERGNYNDDGSDNTIDALEGDRHEIFNKVYLFSSHLSNTLRGLDGIKRVRIDATFWYMILEKID